MSETPPYLLPFLLDPPLPEVETVDGVDLYLPAGDEPAPAVVLVHGGPISDEMPKRPREWPAYVGYGSLLAEAGLVGVMFEHGFREGRPLAEAYADVVAAIDTARQHPRVDSDRLAVWVFSAGGALVGPFLAEPPAWLRAVATTYAYLGESGEQGLIGATEAVAAGVRVPALVTRVEHEVDWVEASVRGFLAITGEDVTVLDVPGARHGFETVDHTDAARDAVRAAVAWVDGRLRG